MTARRRAVLILALGAALAIGAQLAMPAGVPLYDGVVLQEPYRYLSPAADQTGGPTAAHAEPAIEGGKSAAFVAATQEYPPQAQLIAATGAFLPGAGQTSIAITIEPVAPDRQPSSGQIAGNVYRVSAADGSGATAPIAADQPPTLSLRAPEGAVTVQMARLSEDGWHELPTGHGGLFGLYSTQVVALGDFALIAADTGPGLLPIAAALGAAVILLAGAIVIVFRRRRGRAGPIAPGTRRVTAVPSRKRPTAGRRRGPRS